MPDPQRSADVPYSTIPTCTFDQNSSFDIRFAAELRLFSKRIHGLSLPWSLSVVAIVVPLVNNDVVDMIVDVVDIIFIIITDIVVDVVVNIVVEAGLEL